MKTINIIFTYASFKLLFENDMFADNFRIVFQASVSPIEQYDNTIYIKGNDNTKYSIYLNNNLVGEDMSRNEAAYCVISIFGNDICSHTDDSICILHAASVLMNGRIVSFSGLSGAGKTTLSLLFSKYGYFVGDEYAFLDIKTGDLWHEQHPFQLKDGNQVLLPDIDPTLMIAAEGEWFRREYYVSLVTTNYRKVERNHHIKVKVLVFPHFESSCTTTVINILSPSELPVTILQSLMGKDSPSMLFRRFMQMANEERLQFIEIKFCDGVDAAAKLFEYINRQMEEKEQ